MRINHRGAARWQAFDPPGQLGESPLLPGSKLAQGKLIASSLRNLAPAFVEHCHLRSVWLVSAASMISPGAQRARRFQFERDTFAFAHELVWQYRFDAATGQMTTVPHQSAPHLLPSLLCDGAIRPAVLPSCALRPRPPGAGCRHLSPADPHHRFPQPAPRQRGPGPGSGPRLRGTACVQPGLGTAAQSRMRQSLGNPISCAAIGAWCSRSGADTSNGPRSGWSDPSWRAAHPLCISSAFPVSPSITASCSLRPPPRMVCSAFKPMIPTSPPIPSN